MTVLASAPASIPASTAATVDSTLVAPAAPVRVPSLTGEEDSLDTKSLTVSLVDGEITGQNGKDEVFFETIHSMVWASYSFGQHRPVFCSQRHRRHLDQWEGWKSRIVGLYFPVYQPIHEPEPRQSL